MAASSKVPQWKMIPGCGFAVDAFRHAGAPAIKAFFLSHAHSDHYTGITDRWEAGEIFCSEITGRLLVHLLGVRQDMIRPLPMREPQMIQGVEVTLVDANHCPGAVQFLFRLPDGRRYIHCGDMRFCDKLLSDPQLCSFQGCDAIFLDTTYCNPKHRFPAQEESVAYVVRQIAAYLRTEPPGGPSHIFVISTYTIGKERILSAVARHCNLKIECTERKMGTLRCLGLEDDTLAELFTQEEGGGQVLLTSWGALGETWPFFRPNWTKLEAIRQQRGASKAIGFVPTGWTFKADAKEFPIHEKDDMRIHLVPYSEHSSFDELQRYVRFLRPKQVIPTVGVSGDNGEKNRAKMLSHFRNLVDMQSSKANFLQSMAARSAEPTAAADDPQQGAASSPLQAAAAPAEHHSAGASSVTVSPRNGNTVSQVPPDDGAPSDEEEMVIVLPGPSEHAGDAKACPHTTESSCKPRSPQQEKTDEVDQIMAVLQESSLKREDVAELLRLARGDVERAINLHYDQGPKALTSPHCANYCDSTRVNHKRPPSNAAPLSAAKKNKRGGKNKSVASPTSKGGSSGSQLSIMAFMKGGSRDAAVSKAKARAEAGTAAVPSPTASHLSPHPALSTRDDERPRDSSDDIAEEEDTVPLQGAIQPAACIPFLTPVAESSSQGSLMDNCIQCSSTGVQPEGSQASLVDETVLETKLPVNKGKKLVLPPPPSRVASAHGEQVKVEKRCAPEEQVDAADITLDPLKYMPGRSACWKPPQAAPYLHIARAFVAVTSTTKRLAIRDVFTNCFRAVLELSPEDLLAASYLACGKLAPDHENVDLSVGEATVAATVMEATGTSRSRLREMYRELGDLGDVAQSCRRNQVMLMKPAPLTVSGVYKTLRRIAAEKGSGSGARRKHLILGLLRSAREEETRFLVRMLIQNLRVGANWRSVLGALGRAAAIHHEGCKITKAQLEKAEAATVEAFHLCPSLDVLVPAIIEHGPSGLQAACKLLPGLPIKPMLAKAAEGVGEALRSLAAAGGSGGGSGGGAVLGEYKYDGQRAQIHLTDARQVHIFSRNGESKTASFPDVAELLLEAAGQTQSLIIDAEIVAIDRENGNRIRAFQELSTRARSAISSADVKVEVAVFVFDLLLLNGEPMLDLTLRQRRERLQEALPNLSPGRVELACSTEITKQAAAEQGHATAVAPFGAKAEAALQEFLVESFSRGAEGLMLKQLDSGGYQPSKRSDSWLKIKKDYCEGLRDSLDLVPIGAWHGNGRKAGWLSPFLLAAWDPVNEEFQSVCRVMSGFTDQFYAEATERLGNRHRIDGPKPYYVTGENCSVWFEPVEVWEIRGADLTISPVHKAARGHIHADRGVSMRFPRFIRIRDDKAPEDASGPDVIVRLFNQQTRKAGGGGPAAGEASRGKLLAASAADASPAVPGPGKEASDDDNGALVGLDTAGACFTDDNKDGAGSEAGD